MNLYDYSLFWNEALKQLEQELGEHEFSLWFNIDYISATADTISVRVPSAFYRDQFIKNYQSVIETKLADLTGKSLTLDFVVEKKSPGPSASAQEENKPAAAKNKEKKNDPPYKSASKHPLLRTELTFENFVIGENNSFAANAALAISKNPGTAYNPFLIYGGVGLGKTHLMQSIGNRVWAEAGKAKIICVTAEAFMNEFIQSIHDKTGHNFKNKYRQADILLVDDIQFLEKKMGLQEELFHTFNALYDANKQMVFTCDRPVSELKNLEERWRSRFERCLNVDLQPPNYETRCAILRKKAESFRLSVPDEVTNIIAKNISTNVRDLEAALMKLDAYAALVGKTITLEIAQQQLKDVFSQSKHGNVTIDHILRVVADQFKISYGDLKGKKRTKNIVFPRQVAMYIAREITEYSTTELGLEFGGRDHTTVMHGCQKIEERLKLDPSLETTIQHIVEAVKEMSSKG